MTDDNDSDEDKFELRDKREPRVNEQSSVDKQKDFAEEVGTKAARKLKAQRNPAPGVWFGLGMMGLIGWSVTVPTLLGAALGLWLDKYHAGPRSWTLALLMAGLAIGCFNAWHWVAKEDKAMHEKPEEHEQPDNKDE